MSEEYVFSDYDVMNEVLKQCNLAMRRCGEDAGYWLVLNEPKRILKRGYIVDLVAEVLYDHERECSSENILAIINLLKER